MLNRYAKAPQYHYDKNIRDRLLDEADRKFSLEIQRGMQWLRDLAAGLHNVDSLLSRIDLC